MLSTQMMKLAERNQWKTNTDEQSVFGEFNGYLFTGLEGKGFKTFITPLAGISQEGLQSLFRFLDKNSSALRLYNYEAEDNFLCIRIREGLIPLSADKIEYLLAQVSGLLALNEMPTDACVICGEKANRKGLYYGLFCHLHLECQDREMNDFTKQPGKGQDADDSADIEIEDEADCADEAYILDNDNLAMESIRLDEQESNQ